MMPGARAGLVSVLAAVVAVGICMLAAPLRGHPAGWLLPAASAASAGLGVLSGAVGWKAYRHYRLSSRLRALAREAMVDGVEVQALPGAKGAFVAGLRRPQIFCSPRLVDDLDAEELRAVLLHERYHQLDRAPAKLVVLEALAMAVRRLSIGQAWMAGRIAALEIAADGHALAMGSSRAALARALLKLGPSQPEGFGLGFSTAAELRLQALVDGHHTASPAFPLVWRLAPLAVAALCILLVLAG